MTIHTPRRTRRLALAAAAVVALGAAAFSTSPASAAPGDGGTGSITVHKLEQGNGTIGPNDGSQVDTTGSTPLVAGFTTCAISGLDLSDSGEWDRLRAITLTPGLNGAAPLVTEGGTTLSLTGCTGEQLTAAATGTTAFTALPADRAYVVWESTPAAGAVASAQPTLVTVPYPGNGTGPAWNYAPHLYPKNVIIGSGSTKTGEVVGDQVTFDVTLPINPLSGTEQYTEVRINDQLGAFLEYTGGAVVLTGLNGDPVPLTAGTDYTLTAPTGGTATEVVLSFTASGLALVNANVGGQIVLTIEADAVGTGSTANQASVTLNGTTAGGPSVVDPTEFFSGAHIVKLAQNKGASSTVPLAGAQFAVYPAAATATSCPADPGSATAVLTAQESAASGQTPDRVLGEGRYCVYETKVPSGYKGLVGGILLDVVGEGSSVSVTNTQVGSDAGDLPGLPLTGAAGTILMIVIGALLLAFGLLLAAARRRSAEDDQAAGLQA